MLVVGASPRAQTAPEEAPPGEEAPPATAPEAPADDYVAYGEHDLTKLLGSRMEDGREKHFVDFDVVNRVFADLEAHAKIYPTNFRSDAERGRAHRDADVLSKLLDMLTSNEDIPVDLLLFAGRTHAIAHNLDVPEAAGRARSTFERLLAREPEHAQGNFHFGVFLAASNSAQEAVPYLEKATAGGIDGAWFSLGMALVTCGENEKGLAALEKYLEKFPDDVQTRAIADAVRDGNIEFKVHDGD